MSEQVIELGQVWLSKDGKRAVQITGYKREWDDATYRNQATGRHGVIFGCYLRARYDLTPTPTKDEPVTERTTP